MEMQITNCAIIMSYSSININYTAIPNLELCTRWYDSHVFWWLKLRTSLVLDVCNTNKYAHSSCNILKINMASKVIISWNELQHYPAWSCYNVQKLPQEKLLEGKSTWTHSFNMDFWSRNNNLGSIKKVILIPIFWELLHKIFKTWALWILD
jgi:hypothetical protein